MSDMPHPGGEKISFISNLQTPFVQGSMFRVRYQVLIYLNAVNSLDDGYGEAPDLSGEFKSGAHPAI